MPGYMMHLCEAAYIENIILNSDKGDVDTVISRALISVFNSPDSTNEFLPGKKVSITFLFIQLL